jgi:hypothetical protein
LFDTRFFPKPAAAEPPCELPFELLLEELPCGLPFELLPFDGSGGGAGGDSAAASEVVVDSSFARPSVDSSRLWLSRSRCSACSSALRNASDDPVGAADACGLPSTAPAMNRTDGARPSLAAAGPASFAADDEADLRDPKRRLELARLRKENVCFDCLTFFANDDETSVVSLLDIEDCCRFSVGTAGTAGAAGSGSGSGCAAPLRWLLSIWTPFLLPGLPRAIGFRACPSDPSTTAISGAAAAGVPASTPTYGAHMTANSAKSNSPLPSTWRRQRDGSSVDLQSARGGSARGRIKAGFSSKGLARVYIEGANDRGHLLVAEPCGAVGARPRQHLA